ncbi:hypothetical protein B0H16DRAFT_154362 [Mycena metata]|uniref:Uncharacterized protein n=1 Tax=Mycena metata TaxID=1033252 RepID=A0AAD7I3J6_9AGAR|nr:hypothetical protein B0H16DRAFT_154362 [Mycena metata]
MGLESLSDPEEVADAGSDDADGDGDGDVSSVSHASHAVLSASHVAASTFSRTHAHHGSNSSTHSSYTASTSSGARSSEVDTEEDPVAPITPLPGWRTDVCCQYREGQGQNRGRRIRGARGRRQLRRRGRGDRDRRQLGRPRQPGPTFARCGRGRATAAVAAFTTRCHSY